MNKPHLSVCFFFTATMMYAGSVFGQISGIPQPPRIPVTATYCGDRTVSDNYRWMENMKDTSVARWFRTQGGAFESLMNQIPGRDSIYALLCKLDSLHAESISGVCMRNNRYFFFKSQPGERTAGLYFRKGKAGPDELLFEPYLYEKGKLFDITFMSPSEDGSKVAFGVAEGGSEISRILILDVDKKTLYPETIYPSWFGVFDWTEDNQSFFYSAHKTPDIKAPDFMLDTKLMLHRIGTKPVEDAEIFSREHNPDLNVKPSAIIFGKYSADRNYFIASLAGVDMNMDLYYCPASTLHDKNIPWKRLVSKSDEATNFTFSNDSLYVITHRNAPHSKLVVTSARNPDLAHARVVIPEGRENLESVSRTTHALLIVESDGINHSVLQYDPVSTKLKKIESPRPGSCEVYTYGKRSDECLLTVRSLIHPVQFFDYDAVSGKTEKSKFDRSVDYPGAERLEVREVEVKSPDGVMVPLSIICLKDLKLDGKTPCILDGYGAYGISNDPGFSNLFLVLEKYQVIYAIAHVRGGGEKGEAWHQGGFKKTKSNTWKDFIACAEYLIENKYTSSDKLAGEGTSAGGILIGRAITERPDLFAAGISISGDCNTLRSETTPNGPNNVSEFGSVNNPDECAALLEMDALSHVKDGVKYPAVLCVVGMNDPRVMPWSSGKFAAAIQNSSISGKPAMLRVDYDSGHFSDDKNIVNKQDADVYAYILWTIGHPSFKRK